MLYVAGSEGTEFLAVQIEDGAVSFLYSKGGRHLVTLKPHGYYDDGNWHSVNNSKVIRVFSNYWW